MTKFLVKTHVLLLTLMVGLIACSSAFGAATIVIQNNDQPGVGFNDPTPVAPVGGNNGSTLGEQRLNAFQFAANIWGATLNSGPPITVRASWVGLPCTANSGTIGSAGAVSIRRDFPGALFAATWYSVAIANSLSGSDLNGPTAEMSAQLNVNVGTPGCLENRQWYYGLDTNHGINRINLVTVLLHEFSHGLGFQTFTDEETGAQASGFASIYDRFLFDNTAGKTWVEMTDAERVASAINTGNLVWNGPQVTNDAATVLTGGKDSLGRPRMFAPNPVDSGSSVSHWDTVATPNQLMEPNISTSLSHNVTPPQDLTTSLMKDIGWPATVGPPPSPTPTPSPPPNDNFANAQAISGCSGSVPGTNVAATREIGEPNHSPDNNGGSRSVWYQWQSPSNSSVTLTTVGSNFDTVLGVYTGTAVGALTLIGSNDDVTPGSDISSRVIFAANAGTTYRIAVDGYNNDNSGGDVGTLSLNWSATNCTAQPTIQFSTSNYSAGEGNSRIDVVVTRSGATTGAATVGYATADGAGLTNCDVVNGIASPRCDFPVSIGTVSFAAGETSKTLSIPIVDDSYAEGPENFTISLSNASGANLAAPSTATLTINDNESSNGPNPIALTAFFVRQHYIDFLGREPDPPGFAGWQAVINNCPQGDITCDRIHVSGAFYQSPEFQQRGYFVYRFYPVSFGRKPDYAEFIPDLARVSGFLDAAQLEAVRVAFVNDFMARPAFVSRYNSLSNTAYVDTLLSAAGITHAERDFWIAALTNGTRTRAEVLREITESNEVSQRYFNQAFVVMQYFGYLRRDPDAFYLNWIQVLDSTGDSRGMISGFVNSNEYRFRFGP